MAARARGRATYEDLLEVPDRFIAELIDGELYAWQRPRATNLHISSVLGMLIGPPYRLGERGPGGWWILDAPELHFGDDVLVPDVCGWRWERMPSLPEGHIFDVAPDWVSEVLSPSTSRIDRARKMPIYAGHGVSYAWVVDPDSRTLEVMRLEGGHWLILQVFSGNDVVRAEPFDAVEIDLASLWGEMPQET